MTYIIQRQNRFYVVAYEGTDPATGRERRRWHPAGHSRADAEAIAARLADVDRAEHVAVTEQLTLGRYLAERWMPRRRMRLQATTAYRYQWMIDNYITPALGSMPLRSLQAEHLDRLYTDLLTTGGTRSDGLASKTVYDVHVIIRSALGDACRQHLVTTNIAHAAQPPRPRVRERSGPECWTADQLATFLDTTRHLRLYPALHLASTTGMRRGELAGLRWGDWHRSTQRLSIARSRQVVAGRSTEVPGQDQGKPALHRSRHRHRVRARTLAATPTPRRPPDPTYRSDLHQRCRQARARRIDLAAVHPTGRTRPICLASASTTCATPTPPC